jgi:hypothetical protein
MISWKTSVARSSLLTSSLRLAVATAEKTKSNKIAGRKNFFIILTPLRELILCEAFHSQPLRSCQPNRKLPNLRWGAAFVRKLWQSADTVQ